MSEPSSLLRSEYQSIASQYFSTNNATNSSNSSTPSSAIAMKRALDAERRDAAKRRSYTLAHVSLVGLFVWLLSVWASGIYLFTNGFLLTRLVLDERSACESGLVERSGGASYDGGCWHPKTFDKAVIILVDALRYDFTVPFEGGKEDARLYHNAFPVLHETALQHPERAFLLPFISDPPTTTLQRIKGLTTGTLPTFMDAGSNFAGTAIEEDNLVTQLKSAGKRLVHLGDDVWQSLFPGHFDEVRSRPFDSFNVWDLHTVDNGVTENLMPLLSPSKRGDWDVIFGHFLGVDHAGHRYGPDHPAMATKLQQMNRVMRDIIAALDDDTLLVVMGDHGMDSKGDHGGESDDEIESALWMYSKKGIFGRTKPEYVQPPRTAKERPVPQIDLVPTLSLLLGIPIPFNNLGSPIDEAFIGAGGKSWKNLAEVNRLTSAQIKRYQTVYTATTGEDKAGPEPLAALVTAEEYFRTLAGAWSPTATQFQEASTLFRKYQRDTLATCRGLWAEFNVPSMIQGIGLLAAGLAFLLVYARGFWGDRLAATPDLLIKIAGGTVAGVVVGTVVGPTVFSMPVFSSAVLSGNIGGLVGAGFVLTGLRNKIHSVLPNSMWGWLAFTVTVAQAIGFASNSYTIWEDEMLLFFLTTFGVLAGFSSMRQRNAADRMLGIYHSFLFVVLTRLASLSRLCREEQMPLCRSTFYASANSSTSAPWQLFIPFLVALLLPSIIKSYYNGTLSYQGSAVLWIGFAFRMSLLFAAVYWAIDVADDGDWVSLSKETLKTSKIMIAQLVIAIAVGAGVATFAWSKPCINIGMSTAPAQEQSGGSTQTPAQPRTTVTILGFANVYGSHYFLLISAIVILAILVQKPMGSGSLAILTWQILSLVEILDTNNLTEPVSSIGPTVLAMLGSFHFFKTGHQATLSSIQWDSAFVPLRTVTYPWSPLLILLNTFGPQIITAAAVPLVVLWKRPVSTKAGGGAADKTKASSANDLAKQEKDTNAQLSILSASATAISTHLIYYATLNLATTVWAMWLRRHLMLYRIFNPRFMMGALVLVVDGLAALVGLIAVRWTGLSVGSVFGW